MCSGHTTFHSCYKLDEVEAIVVQLVCGPTRVHIYLGRNFTLDTFIRSSIYSLLRPLVCLANVPRESLFSATLFIMSYRFEPVQSLKSSTHVRLGLPLPRLPSSLPSIVLSRVSQSPDVFRIMWPA